MKLLHQTKFKWVVICFLGGLFVFIFYWNHSQLRIQAVKLWDLFQDYHQLRRVIKSFGPYSPVVFISLHVLHAVIPPFPGEAIEFLGGYLFGVRTGMFYSMIGLIIGS